MAGRSLVTFIGVFSLMAVAFSAVGDGFRAALRLYVEQTKSGAWTEKGHVPEARIFEIAANIRGRIYAVTSGEDGRPGTEVFEYTPQTDSWMKRKVHANLVRHSFGAATFHDRIYIWGGVAGGQVVGSTEVYDPATDRWTTLADMPHPRLFAKGASVLGKLYAVGGIVPPGRNQVPLIDEYDPRRNRWTARTDMPRKRDAYRVAAVGGRIYVLGNLDYSTEVLEFDPAADTWKIKAAMPTPRFDFGIAVSRGLIFTFGGMGRNTVEAYDPARDLWFRKQPMPRDNWEQVAAESLGKILVIGGGFPAPNVLDIVYQYDPAADTEPATQRE